MNNFKKVLAFLIILSIIFIGIYAYLKIKRTASIEKNQIFIKTKIFSKDSENRGYSDRAKSLMEEELSNFNNDPIMRIYFDKILKQERIKVLSKTKKEYIENFSRWSKLNQCLIRQSIRQHKGISFKKWLNPMEKFESESMIDLIYAVESEFKQSLAATDYELMFKRPNEQECKDFLNE